MRVARTIELTDLERNTLTKWSRGRSTPARLVLRAKIMLLAADGRLNKDIAADLETFKVSSDPKFAEKLVDAVGLYLDPPEHALVLSVDEKSQIQALDRTQKSLPMFPRRLGTMTHDYKRNGTTTLFAGLCLPRSNCRKEGSSPNACRNIGIKSG